MDYYYVLTKQKYIKTKKKITQLMKLRKIDEFN